MKKLLYVLTSLCLLASVFTGCEKPNENSEGGDDTATKNYTETAFGINMEMVYVEGGEFTMGLTKDQKWKEPDSIVEKFTRETKLDSYYIGKFEVTQAQWKAVMGTTLSDILSENRWFSFGLGDNYPMYDVSWNDVQEFCKKLSEQTGKKYVLPTEAQWEYAARGGVHKTKTMYAGSNDIEAVAWFYENSYNLGSGHPDYGTHLVGMKKANALGIYDMSGNVWEWCSDWFSDAGYDKNDDYNPQGSAEGAYRVVRGGGWGTIASSCRVSFQGYIDPNYRSADIGFRMVVLP